MNYPNTYSKQTTRIFSLPDDNIDEFSWIAYTSPFAAELWLSLLIFALAASIILWIFLRCPKTSTKSDLLECIAISTLSLFRYRIKDANDTKAANSVRITVFVVFVFGSLFYYFYLSSLRSSLAVPKMYKPFTSPEEILFTNYR